MFKNENLSRSFGSATTHNVCQPRHSLSNINAFSKREVLTSRMTG